VNSTDSWIAAAAFLASFIGTGMLRRYALRNNLLDVPNSRSSHQSPTPRGGGAAIVVAFFISTYLLVALRAIDSRFVSALWIGGGLIALIGIIDDRKPQSARRRLIVHVVAAAAVVHLVGEVALQGPKGGLLAELWLFRVIAVVALVWVSNLFNFMDGIDGIAGTEAIFVMTSAAWLNSHFGKDAGLTSAMLCLAAAGVGFVLWNWPRAKIFMGDVGSGFLGFVIGVFGLYTSWNGGLHLIVWIILGGVFLTDSTVTLLRRMLRRERWTEAHRMHAYQHAARRWNAHWPVTTAVAAINVVWLLPFAFLAIIRPSLELLWLIIAIGPLVALALMVGAGRKE